MNRGPIIAMLISAAATATIVAGLYRSPERLREAKDQGGVQQEELSDSMEHLLPLRIVGCGQIIGEECSKYDDGLKSNCAREDGSDAYLCCATSVPDGPVGRWLECDWNDEDGVIGCDAMLGKECEKKGETGVCAEGAYDYLALRCDSVSKGGRLAWIRSPLPSCERFIGTLCVKGSFLCLREVDEQLDRLCCRLDKSLGERSYLPCNKKER